MRSPIKFLSEIIWIVVKENGIHPDEYKQAKDTIDRSITAFQDREYSDTGKYGTPHKNIRYISEYIKNNGNWDLNSTKFKEDLIEKTKNSGKIKKNGYLRVEHCTPKSMLLEMTENYRQELNVEITPRMIEDFIEPHLTLCLILAEEDLMLSTNKVHKSYPPEYYDETHELYKNKFARYIVASIKLWDRKNKEWVC